MANLDGANPNLTRSDQQIRRKDALDSLLVIGDWSGISATDSAETGIALDAERLNAYRAVVHHSANAASDGGTTNYWAITVTGADNSSFTNEVTLATYNTYSSSGAVKEYLALSGEMVNSLRTAAGEDEVIYVRTVATKNGTPSDLTGGCYLSCD